MMHNTFKTHKMTENGAAISVSIREKASELLDILDCIPCTREMAIAKTKLEECVMWANKAVALEVES